MTAVTIWLEIARETGLKPRLTLILAIFCRNGFSVEFVEPFQSGKLKLKYFYFKILKNKRVLS